MNILLSYYVLLLFFSLLLWFIYYYVLLLFFSLLLCFIYYKWQLTASESTTCTHMKPKTVVVRFHHRMRRIGSEKHEIYTYDQMKISLNPYDNMRYIHMDKNTFFTLFEKKNQDFNKRIFGNNATDEFMYTEKSHTISLFTHTCLHIPLH